MLWDAFPAPEGADAGFAVAVTDDSLLPWVMPGETVLFQRNTELSDGDVGLFETDAGLVFRQFCADSRGAVYLFAVNRSRVIAPEKASALVCYGRAVLRRRIPLPMD